jgi:hypothetical protein
VSSSEAIATSANTEAPAASPAAHSVKFMSPRVRRSDGHACHCQADDGSVRVGRSATQQAVPIQPLAALCPFTLGPPLPSLLARSQENARRGTRNDPTTGARQAAQARADPPARPQGSAATTPPGGPHPSGEERGRGTREGGPWGKGQKCRVGLAVSGRARGFAGPVEFDR